MCSCPRLDPCQVRWSRESVKCGVALRRDRLSRANKTVKRSRAVANIASCLRNEASPADLLAAATSTSTSTSPASVLACSPSSTPLSRKRERSDPACELLAPVLQFRTSSRRMTSHHGRVTRGADDFHNMYIRIAARVGYVDACFAKSLPFKIDIAFCFVFFFWSDSQNFETRFVPTSREVAYTYLAGKIITRGRQTSSPFFFLSWTYVIVSRIFFVN